MFLSDNFAAADNRIMEALVMENFKGGALPYGEDSTSKWAVELIQSLFETKGDVLFVSTGTSGNIIGLAGLLKSYEGVITVDSSHLNTDECGAFEKFTGSKLLLTPNKNGKLDLKEADRCLKERGDYHSSQPRVISISQTSELGTVYSLEEMKAIGDYCKENGLYFHVDGARLSNAIVACESSFIEMISKTGVDLLTLGGAKNGLAFGEAIVVLNEELGDRYNYIRKQAMQLTSKMRYVSCQFIPYLKEGIWHNNARIANSMARKLGEELSGIKGVDLIRPVESNMIFARLDKDLLAKFEGKKCFYITDEDEGIVRLVTSHGTREEDIENFIKILKGA